MAWTSILAIYFLFWVVIAFIMLPFGVKTADESGEALVPGQAESAPVNFKPKKIVIRATIVASIVTALYVLNYEYGWIGVDVLDVLPDPPVELEPES